ncbi:MAG: HAD-IIA family hydrolase [Acidimicrobiia bacterium]|nr:HAD-IIA family hydrolase [Acidimicrobiia bacterium]MBT8214307.1 HAD-IIA family hydrolase [Acidimicrobiia bacterium]NNK91165.1 HAD-IIA family hydrolase [Acidimicrobiia bacterium]
MAGGNVNVESRDEIEGLPNLLVCDLDGVVYLEDEPIPGAADAIEAIRDGGWRVIFATNNATRTGADLVRALADRAGVVAEEHDIVSAAMAVVSLIERGPVFIVGESGLVDTVHQAGFEITTNPESAATVALGLDRALSYEKLASATKAILGGASFIAANHDPSFPTPSGLVPGGGAIAAALATASGIQPIYAGKPEVAMRDLIIDRAGDVDQVWVVGDRPDADVALAQEAGWSSALVLSGVIASPDAIPPQHRPDVVLGSIAELPTVLGL